MELGSLVALTIAFVGGSGFSKLLEIISDRVRGATERRRAEVDSIAKQLARAIETEERAARRERLAIEHSHELRSMLLTRGVPSSELPVFDLGD